MNQQIHSTQIEQVIHRARRRQWRQWLLTGFFGLMAMANVVFAIVVLSRGATGLASALPALAITIVSVLLLSRIWRAQQRERTRYQSITESNAVAINRACDATRERIGEYQRTLRLVGLVVLPLFMVALGQLWFSGKMTMMQIGWFLMLLLPALATVFAVLRHRIRTQLLPQIEMLERLREQLGV